MLAGDDAMLGFNGSDDVVTSVVIDGQDRRAGGRGRLLLRIGELARKAAG